MQVSTQDLKKFVNKCQQLFKDPTITIDEVNLDCTWDELAVFYHRKPRPNRPECQQVIALTPDGVAHETNTAFRWEK